MDIRISVITPISPDHKIFLPELAESVDLLKKITNAEWIACCDGFPVEDLEINEIYPDIKLENTKPEGIAMSRNRCLAAASGNMIAPIDADDIISPHGLGTAAETIKYDRHIGWCGYASQDFDATHQKARIIGEDAEKSWSINECLEYFLELSGEDVWFDAFRANCVVYFRDALEKAGGWPAMPILEDLATLFRVNRKHTGRQISNIGILRRQHKRQTTRTDNYLTEKIIWTRFMLNTLPSL